MDPSNFLEKNAACLNRCGQTCPAFSQVGKALFDAWVIGARRPRPTFLRVLATALSIVRHVTPPWAHIPRKTIQSLRGFGNQDCLRAAQQSACESYSSTNSPGACYRYAGDDLVCELAYATPALADVVIAELSGIPKSRRAGIEGHAVTPWS
jgi:hypothetical protein